MIFADREMSRSPRHAHPSSCGNSHSLRIGDARFGWPEMVAKSSLDFRCPWFRKFSQRALTTTSGSRAPSKIKLGFGQCG
jgi:hypothetical protein